VVKILLERLDVDPNTADEDGQTPLFRAASDGYEGVVQTLLGRVDVNTDIADLAGETALSQALKNGHHAIIKLLSKRKNSVPLSDSHKSTMPSSPKPPGLDQRPFKRIRRF